LTCRVVEIADPRHDLRIVGLDVVDGGPFAFRPGQYASVTFGELPPRDYSMANRSEEARLEFHIGHDGGGDGVSGYVARQLRLGEEVRLEGPYGNAWLRREHRGPVLAIAGGSGLAPIKSIVETLLEAGARQDIHLYYSAGEAAELYLDDRFRALADAHANFRYVPVLSRAEPESGRRSGRIGDLLLSDFGEFTGIKAYLAGPPALVESLVELLAAAGLAEADIHADPFITEAEKVARQAAEDRDEG
jgi:CDP-4-dehydro-6-deoxyglucose reductase/ferredoxin-NAD(P)+ reductase (naphthalene dioxygenase ferredoxin-specific)